MRVAFFVHSIVSDWNHGNAHFLRGVVRELRRRGHEVRVFEPAGAWSLACLGSEPRAAEALDGWRRSSGRLPVQAYALQELDADRVLEGTDAVIVHEWNDPRLVALLGAWRERHRRARLLFHDTHHRAVTAPRAMAAYDLRRYDGVLAFGRVLRDLYLERGWAARAWTWHEAADTAVFRPLPAVRRDADLVWVGNWGDGERTAELQEYLVRPTAELGLRATVYGVRWPEEGRRALERAGIAYGGWLPNLEVPHAFARHRVTVHVPRGPYARALPGIPTIRPFEALACGIPMVSAPWEDAEGLFAAGTDHLVARTGKEMASHLRMLQAEPETAAALAEAGRRTVLARHTCAHRVDELLEILEHDLGLEAARHTLAAHEETA